MAEYNFSDRVGFMLNVTNVTNRYYADSLYTGHYVPGAPRAVSGTLTRAVLRGNDHAGPHQAGSEPRRAARRPRHPGARDVGRRPRHRGRAVGAGQEQPAARPAGRGLQVAAADRAAGSEPAHGLLLGCAAQTRVPAAVQPLRRRAQRLRQPCRQRGALHPWHAGRARAHRHQLHAVPGRAGRIRRRRTGHRGHLRRPSRSSCRPATWCCTQAPACTASSR